jgi:hypothetical protein
LGDIWRRIDICGLTENARRLRQANDVLALVDTGASKTVISTKLSTLLGGSVLMKIPMEGRRVPSKLIAIRMQAPGCGEHPIVVAVDDDLVDRAGRNPEGEQADVILGHDYLEAERAVLKYLERGDDVRCEATPPLPPQTRRRKHRAA